MRAYRTIAFVVAFLATMTATTPDWSWSQPLQPATARYATKADSLRAIARLTEVIVAANRWTPEKVPIGAFVRVPDRPGKVGTFDALYEVNSWAARGDKSCYWRIAAFHLFGIRELPDDLLPPDSTSSATLEDISRPEDAKPAVPAPSTWDQVKDWAMWLLVLLLVALLLLGLYWFITSLVDRRREREWSLNPAAHQPLVQGGLSSNPSEALTQIQTANIPRAPDRRERYVTRGRVVSRHRTRRSFLASMEFGDGLVRPVRIHSGDAVWLLQVTEFGRTATELWYQDCGNRFRAQEAARLNLPQNWEFVEDEPRVSAVVPDVAVIPQPVPTPVPVPNNVQAEADAAAQSVANAQARIAAGVVAHAQANPSGVYKLHAVVENGDGTKVTIDAQTEGQPMQSVKKAGVEIILR